MSIHLFVNCNVINFVINGMITMVLVSQYHELAAEAFYLKAIVFDKLGRLEEREEAATSFKKHIMALKNPHDEDSLASML